MPNQAPKRIMAIFALGAWYAGAEPRIESFSPTGHTKDVGQVAVRFSEPMVALGDPDTSDPFAVACDVPGNGRWIDDRNWVYDFAYDVPGAERCRFTLRHVTRTNHDTGRANRHSLVHTPRSGHPAPFWKRHLETARDGADSPP